MTPIGSKKQAATVFIPVKELMTAAPPVNNIAVTRMLVMIPKTAKTIWVVVPNRALMTSRKVCAFGALLLSSIAMDAKSKI